MTISKAILVLNAGSSSLKFSLYAAEDAKLNLVAKGQIEGLPQTPRFKAQDHSGTTLAAETLQPAAGEDAHAHAFRHLAQWLREHYAGKMELAAVGHRMTHGGAQFSAPALITPEVLSQLESLTGLAPLHLPHNLAGVNAVKALRPELSQVACFDTAFHCNRGTVSERYGLPQEWFDKGVKRWGFHGLSYESIAGQFQKLSPQLAAGRVIVGHLGSGASLCAMKAGRSVDTTMGFSTLDGVPMATRCGSLDPGVILYLLREMTPDGIEDLLYHKSGMVGISGLSGNMRELLASPNPRAREAVDYFIYRTVREIGALVAVLGGLDALIFTAGIGENSPQIRARIAKELQWLGITIDAAANEQGRQLLSPAGSAPAVWVLRTDEESVIAAHTRDLIGTLSRKVSGEKHANAATTI